jgi:hypothetical protein
VKVQPRITDVDLALTFSPREEQEVFLGVATPPLEEKGWEGFPVVARVVDRGDPHTTASDIGAMELYAFSVVSSDPLEVARLLRECLSSGKES